MPTNIYHICTREEWESQKSSSDFIHPSLKTEGFIHCSLSHQVEGVLLRYFKGKTDLLKLEIDPQLLSHKCVHEASSGGELFPHIYGPINKDAIVKMSSV